MKTLLATIDRAAEYMEKAGHSALAAVLDSVSDEMTKRKGDEYECPHGTCADGSCAEADGSCADGSVATASLKRSFLDAQQPTSAATVLTEAAPTLFEAVKPYGATRYSVDNETVEVALKRGDVETTAAFQFCSQDNVGKPQLRITFYSQGARMVRWASLDTVTGAAINEAADHVFGTGENYGKHVVVAAVKPTYRLVDSIEQAVHDNAKSKASLNRALQAFGTQALKSAQPHVDDWTGRFVSRYLAGN